MIFDKLCGIVERHDQSLMSKLTEAKLFVFDKPAHEFLPKDHDREKIEWLEEHFVLPFPVTAVEDPASCILLMDMDEKAHGLSQTRLFLECMPVHAKWEAFREAKAPDPRVESAIPQDAMIVSSGWVEIRIGQYEPSRYLLKGQVQKCLCLGKRTLYRDFTTDMQFLSASALKNACTALEELMLLNSPDRFILEISPNGSRATRKDRPKILRSHERPTYTLLKPSEIRRVMRLEPDESTEKRTSPIPHERRAHTRTLRSERFKAAKGKTLIIPAVWIGVHEAKIGNKMYRVRLDL